MNKTKNYVYALYKNIHLQNSLSFLVNRPPLTLFCITILAYGLFAAQQGFAWDDWVFAWIPRYSGIDGMHRYYSVDRPILAYLFAFTTSVISPSPLAWQIFAIFWRGMSSIALWWSLGLVWPENKKRNFLVALFSLLYPGFSQHSIAIAYGHYSLLQTAFWASIGLMIIGIKKRNWIALLVSFILAAWQLFSAEYYFGLEILRPIFIWISLTKAENPIERHKKTLFTLVPYILIDLGFLYWRIFIFGFNSYQPDLINDLQAADQQTLSNLPITIFNALYTTTIKAWSLIFQFPSVLEGGVKLFAAYLLIVAVIFGFLVYFLSKQKAGDEISHNNIQWIIAAALSLLTAGIPFYITQLPILLVFSNDRFTMPFIFGSSILLVLILERIPGQTYRTLAISFIAALAVGMQIQYAYQFRQDWNLQKSFFWQMVWRIPDLEPGTTFLSDDSSIQYSTDTSLTFPINWIYNPNNPDGEIKYNYFYISSRLNGSLPSLKKGLPIEKTYRMTVFHGSTDKLLLLQFSPPSCLHILDPIYHKDIPTAPNSIETTKLMSAAGVPLLSRKSAQALHLSNTAQIIPNPGDLAIPPKFIFGPEINRGWCYYFQKADLARQLNDWQEVAAIGDKVFAIPYVPDDVSEYLPFIEAYARVGRLDDARELTLKTANSMPILKPALCGVWVRIEQVSNDQTDEQFANKMRNEIQYCPIDQLP